MVMYKSDIEAIDLSAGFIFTLVIMVLCTICGSRCRK